MAQRLITFSKTGRPADEEDWAIRQGSLIEIRVSGLELLRELRQSYKKSAVFVGGTRLRVADIQELPPEELENVDESNNQG